MTAAPAQTRSPDHPVDPMFTARWSPRAFAGDSLDAAAVLRLVEAARWAPSATNVQPWRFAWGLRGDAGFAAIHGTLSEGNRGWAGRAAALVAVGAVTTRTTADGTEAPNVTHAFDAGAAWMSLALQAHLSGLVAHAMGGFDKTALAKALAVPEGIALFAVVAVGRQGDPAILTQDQQAREKPSQRKPLEEIAGHGRFPA